MTSIKSENFSISLLAFALIFSGANVYALVYPWLKLLVFVSILFFLIINKFDIQFNKTNVVILITLWGWYLFALISSFFTLDESSIQLLFKYFTYLIFLSFLIFSNPKVIYSFYEKYSSLFFYITVFFIFFICFIFFKYNIFYVIDFFRK